MKLLSVGPELFKFDITHQFIREFNIGKGDLLITITPIYEKYFKQDTLNIDVILAEKYGSTEPTDEMIDAMISDVAKFDCKRIIAVGGGACLDMAKVASVSHGQSIDILFEKLPNLSRKVELILIPTTCGTGSEVTMLASINRTRLGTKMGMGCPAMYGDSAVLIPELLNDLPIYVFATSSIDALVHATESALSPNATPYTRLFSYKAIELIINGFKTIIKDGNQARRELSENFIIASNYAGIAFGTAGCAAVHALSYQLGGKYKVPHGESNYAMFTGVLKNYLEIKQTGEIAIFNKYLAELLNCDVKNVYDELETLLNQLLPKKSLREYGVCADELVDFAKTVIKTQTRLMKNNFVPLDEQRVLKIFNELY